MTIKSFGNYVLVQLSQPEPPPGGHIEISTDVLRGEVMEPAYNLEGKTILFSRGSAIVASASDVPLLAFVHHDNILGVEVPDE